MALSDLLEKISKETELALKELEREYSEKIKAIDAKFEKKKKKIDQKIHEKIDESSGKILENARSLAEREAKNDLLSAKRKIIKDCFSSAIEKLCASENYVEMITALLAKTDFKSAEIIPAKDKEEETKKALTASGKPYTVSEKSADIKGGFFIRTEKIEIDNSFETIIYKQLKDELEIKLNKILF